MWVSNLLIYTLFYQPLTQNRAHFLVYVSRHMYVLEGCTQLNKWPIEIHVKMIEMNLPFLYSVTIFWNFWIQKTKNKTWNFYLSFNSCVSFRFDFKIRAHEQRHHYFRPGRSPPSRLRQGYSNLGLFFLLNRKLIFFIRRSNLQATLSHLNHSWLLPLKTHYYGTSKCHK